MRKLKTTASIILLIILVYCCSAIAAGQKLLTDIQFSRVSAKQEQVTFTLNATSIPHIFAIKGERPRVVFDFPDTKPTRVIKNSMMTKGNFIARIRLGIHRQPVPKTRVVFDLQPDKKIDFKQSFDKIKNKLTITLYQAGNNPEQGNRTKISHTPPTQKKQHDTPRHKRLSKKVIHTAPTGKPADQKNSDATAKEGARTDKTSNTTQKTVVQKNATAPTIKKADTNKTSPKQQDQAATETEVTEKKQGTTSANNADQTILNSVSFEVDDKRGEMVLFRLNSFHPPVIFGEEEGHPRVICDFADILAGKNLPDSIATKGKFVKDVRIIQKKEKKTIRVVLNLATDHNYDLQQIYFKEDSLFVIIVNAVSLPKAKQQK